MACSAKNFLATLQHLLLYQLFTFRYFEDLVVKYQVHFDRRYYRRLYGNMGRFCLFQYRSLHRNEPPRKRLLYPETIPKWTWQLCTLTLAFALFLLRTLAVLFLGATTRTRQARILFGTEMWGPVSPYVETTFLFWSIIVWTFYQFSLTGNLLDYKFLAIFRISLQNVNSFTPSTFGLTRGAYLRFDTFRRACTTAYYWTMASIPVIFPTAVCLFQVRASLYQDHLLSSIIWLCIISTLTFISCTVLYSTMLVFLVVVRYLQIKQKSLTVALTMRLGLLSRSPRVSRNGSLLYHNLVDQFTRYSYFQEEMDDVNVFWRTPLTFASLNYCSLVAYFNYIIFLAPTLGAIKFLYTVILIVNLILCGCVITICALLVHRHTRLVVFTGGQVATLGRERKLTFSQNLKIQNISANLKLTKSGFTLGNGHLLTFDSMRVVMVNIAIYFMLAFHA